MITDPKQVPTHWLLIALSGIVLALAFISINLGAGHVSMLDLFETASPDAVDLILFEIRLPRTLIAAIAGASFGVCGAVMQGLLRNPLASPGLVGSSSGAALGAVVVLYLGLSQAFLDVANEPLNGLRVIA